MNEPSVPDQDWSDAQLVAQSKLGDLHAFTLLYRRYIDRVYNFCRHRMATREDAEDATQATFMRALRSIKTCRDGDVFAGWLFAIARNVVNDSRAAEKVRVTALDDAPETADPARSPHELAESAEWIDQLERLRRECLNHADRDLLDLRLQGLNDREISIATNRSYGAVRVAQHRMLRRLRDCLGIGREAEHAVR